MSILPPGVANATTALYAGTKCGNYTQTAQFTTTESIPEVIGFTAPASWSDTQSFTSDAGLIWGCETTGVYNLRFNQTLDVVATAPLASSIIPNTTFYLDAASGTAPVNGSLALTQDLTSQTSVNAAAVSGTVVMAEFLTPVGFLTSPIIPGANWDVVVKASTTGTATDGAAPTPPEPFIGQYYKTTTQNAPTGTTEVTFDAEVNWNNTNGYITHTNGTADFSCQQAGVYQLELNLFMSANGSTWTTLAKDVAINITRIAIAEQQILRNRFSVATSIDWSNTLVGTVELQAGDIVQCVVTQTVTGTPRIQGLLNTFDYNTTFTFTYVKQLANIGVPGMNSLYYSVFSIDADGISNETSIVDGSTGLPPTVINSPDQIFYHLTQTIPPTQLDSISRRIKIKLYATFYTPSTMVLYFRNNAISTAQTTLSQLITNPISDTVNVTITVDSATSEFNQVFTSSIPVTAIADTTATYSTAVNAIANVNAGDQVTCTIASVLGLVTVSSGETTLPDPANTLQWNLLAQGSYGNPDIVLAEPMAVENFGIQDK